MRVLITRIILFVLLTIWASYFALMHTNLPFRLITDALKGSGIIVEGMAGYIDSTIHFDRITIGNEQTLICLLEDVDFTYSGLKDVFQRHVLKVSELNIGKLLIRATNRGDDDIRALFAYPFAYVRASQGLKSAKIDRINILNFKLILPGLADPIRFDTWTLNDLKSDHEELSLSTMKIRSDTLELDFEGSKVSGTLKKAYLPWLKQDITFGGTIAKAGGKVNFDLTGADGKVSLKTNPDESAELNINDLSMENVLKNPHPLRGMKIKITMDNVNRPELSTIRVHEGEFYLGPSRFNIPPDLFVHGLKLNETPQGFVEGHYQLAGGDVKARLMYIPKKVGYFGIRLLSAKMMPDRELIAGILMNKNYGRLTEEQRQAVDYHLTNTSFILQ